MARITLGRENIIIQDYDGNLSLPSHIKKSSYPDHPSRSWRFSRQGDNHTYTSGGDVSLSPNSRNCLVISNGLPLQIKNVRNASILQNSDGLKVIPISYKNETLKYGEKMLQSVELDYTIPKRVIDRENLPELRLPKIKPLLKEFYGINIGNLNPIRSRRSDFGVYKILTEEGDSRILRRWDVSPKVLEGFASLSNGSHSRFPRIFPLLSHSSKHSIVIDNEIYAIEDYLNGDFGIKKGFKDLGREIADMQNGLEQFLAENDWAEEIFQREGNPFSESNLYSLYFDLLAGDKLQTPFPQLVKRIIDEGFSWSINQLPRSIIHGDLNPSNMVYMGPKMNAIDLETMALAPKICEFIPPLIYTGEERGTEYNLGSIENLLAGYSQRKRLTLFETHTLYSLLKLSILKSYNIRNVRRGIQNESNVVQAQENLDKLDEDSKIWL